ncbi:MAG: HAMP domain-containing sensor histidine kinase [Veillonellales bacterium]
MNSIRTKLFLNISLLVILFVLISWGLSALFLEDFYMTNKKHSVIESSQIIDERYRSGAQDISLELERMANNLGAGIVIMSRDGNIQYSSFERIHPQKAFNRHSVISDNGDAAPEAAEGPPRLPPAFVIKSREEVDGNSTIEIEQDQALNIQFMVLRRRLVNEDMLEIKIPLAAVAESAAYASRFIAIVGLLTIAAGGIWAFFFAKRFTVPLLEVSHVAQGISRLDFSRKCTIHSEDEVGRLGKSINNLSYQLNKAISELNQKNQQLTADVEKERRLDKLRKNFISSVSHELKTPISLILGYAEGLKENVAADEDSKNYYCSVVMDEAEKMDKLIQDLLNLSQMESGYFHLERTNFDLSLLLDAVLLKYQGIFSEKRITVEMEKEPGLWVNGDILRIEQVLVNFFNNAIDYVEDKRVIRVSAAEREDTYRVCVYNSGKQVPADSLKELWLSFYKVDQARTRSLGGYGLGLSVVRAIQELHGNAYGVENTADGVMFWFEISKIKRGEKYV